MSDLGFYYYQPAAPVVNVYTTSDSNLALEVTSLSSNVGYALAEVAALSNYSSNYVSELQFQTFLTSNNSELASVSNLATEAYNEVQTLRTDGVIESILNPITTAVGDAFGQLLTDYFNNNPAIQNAIKGLTDQLLGTTADEALQAASNFEPDVSNPALPPSMPDFRWLSNNSFAVERGTTSYGYGISTNYDFNLATGANLNILPSAYLYQTPYGVSYSNSMTTSKKQTILNTTTLTATLCNVTATTSVTSSNALLNTVTFSNQTGSNAWVFKAYNSNSYNSNSYNSNCYASNVIINGNAFLNGQNVITNEISANLASLYINSNQASISATGAAEVFSLNVNSALQVNPNGDAYLNSTKVFDGANSKLIVYDDWVLPSGDRFALNNVLSGNLGSVDDSLFPQAGSSLPQAVLDCPTSFQDLANRKVLQQIVMNGVDVSSWWVL